MNRRVFLSRCAAAAALPHAAALPYLGAPALPNDATIRRIRISTAGGRFHKFVSMNAYDTKPKGTDYTFTLFRVETDAGVEGIAAGSYQDLRTSGEAAALKPLIGMKVGGLFTRNGDLVTGRAPQYSALLGSHRYLEVAFLDILGKLSNKPLWTLLGSAGKTRIPVYDSTVYFADVQFADRGVKAVAEECAESIHAGYRAIKIKLGRGSKWMERKAGDRRDIEVTLAAREAIGPDATLMADPNYGYDNQYDAALNLMREVRPARLLWIEEIFAETPALYARFQRDLRTANAPVKLAFGEHLKQPPQIEPYLFPRVVDFVQYDIRSNGIVDNVAVAKRCATVGAIFTCHNWASQLGYVTEKHLARALGNYGPCECDRSTSEVFHVEPENLRDGMVDAPSAPGLGISIREDVYVQKNAPSEIIVT